MHCPIQYGRTALHCAANMRIVKCLVEEGRSVITTQDRDGATPISTAEGTRIAHYLKAQVKKMVMGIDMNILPFYGGVRGIIVKYLQ